MEFVGIHHVQLAMPPGDEARARSFYGEVLGLPEVAKPHHLAARGGVWFRCGNHEIHLGVQADFRPATKAHPALSVRGLAALRQRLQRAGIHVYEDAPLPGYRRFYASDPFGNRIEFLEPEPVAPGPTPSSDPPLTQAA